MGLRRFDHVVANVALGALGCWIEFYEKVLNQKDIAAIDKYVGPYRQHNPQAPDGPDWLHEIKYDGYRMHARLDRGYVRLLTRTGLDWTRKYPSIAEALVSTTTAARASGSKPM